MTQEMVMDGGPLRSGLRRWAGVLLMAVALAATACASTSAPKSGGKNPASGQAVRPTLAVARSCATGHPSTWMACISNHDPGFANMALSAAAIPGAHDSGTFNLDQTNFDTQDGSNCTSYLPIYASVPATIKAWGQTQTLNFTAQLNAGVRYFDFRIAYTGNAAQGWRIVHTLFSNDPLISDVQAIATWAAAHRSEVVVIDVQHLCYDNSPSLANEQALWAELLPLASVTYDPMAGPPVATATLGGITHQSGGGHNVLLMLPAYSRQTSVLLNVDHVHATFVTDPNAPHPSAGSPSVTGKSVPEAYAWASKVSPTSPAEYAAANHALAAFPSTFAPPLGSLKGSGLYQAQLIYSLSGSDIAADLSAFTHFSGLIPAPTETKSAWEVGLWSSSFNRNSVLAQWGHRLNVVVSDGVQNGGYIPAVVEQNAS
jgi:hypothetical protein